MIEYNSDILVPMTKTDICCIFNLGPLYRKPIYSLMDKELGCDFYLGDYAGTPIKKMDYHSLKGFKGELKYTLLSKFYRLKGTHKATLNSQYKKYVAIGDSNCLSIWYLLFWSKFTRKKVVLWCHGWHSEVSWYWNILLKLFYGMASHVLLYGDYSRNFMIRKGISASKLSCIYNSLDYDKQLEVRSNLTSSSIYFDHFQNDYPVLLYIGRIQKRKRLDMIIEAMYLLRKRGVYTNFVCIGDNTEEIGLKDLIKQYGLQECVWLYGPLYDENKKGEMLYNATVCVSPGNVGLTAMDALNFGLPIITNDDFSTQMPEYEAIQSNQTGLFFRHGDVNDLASCIEQWFDIDKNKSRDFIRTQCYKIIDERYNPHYQIQVLKKVLGIKD